MHGVWHHHHRLLLLLLLLLGERLVWKHHILEVLRLSSHKISLIHCLIIHVLLEGSELLLLLLLLGFKLFLEEVILILVEEILFHLITRIDLVNWLLLLVLEVIELVVGLLYDT